MLNNNEFQLALPKQLRKNLNQEVIDSINNALSDPEEMEIFRENLITYTSVLQQGKFKLESYINAVKYVGFKLMGSTNLNAYIKTFPDKYRDFKARNVPDKDIASYVTAYNKSKLVNLIMEQALVPTHILNAHVFQKAINVQAHIMMSAKSDKVRSDAANSLLTHLKRPEAARVEMDLNINHSGSVIEDYEIAMRRMVEQQQKLIAQGGDTKAIANASVKVCTEEDEDVIDMVPASKEPEPERLFY
jgi:hypothetical protein